MNREELFKLAEEAVRDEELRSAEIPSIDLYVDQIINLVSDKNAKGAERYKDKQLTKTMINNYSKDGLIAPIKGKKYTKEQIIQILCIYSLKNSLSIGEIKRLLDGVYSIENYKEDHNESALTDTYDRYIDIKTDNRELALSVLSQLTEKHELNVEDDQGFILTAGALLSLSSFLREIAQTMIDEKYPVADEAEEKAKPKKAKSKEKGKKQSTKE